MKIGINVFGTGLYDNDVSCDVKDMYRDFLKISNSDEQAYNDLIAKNLDYINDFDDAMFFFLALADTMWNMGRLNDEVKKISLLIIDNNDDLNRWPEEMKKARKKVLDKLREKIISPQPVKKKVGKIYKSKAKYIYGDLLVHKICINSLNEKYIGDTLKESKWNNKYVVFKVVGMNRCNRGSLPREYDNFFSTIAMYNMVFDEEPTYEVIESIENKFLLSVEEEILIFNNANKNNTEMFVFSLTRNELKECEFKLLKRFNDYEENFNHMSSGIGISWTNPHVLDYSVIKQLNKNEKNLILI